MRASFMRVGAPKCRENRFFMARAVKAKQPDSGLSLQVHRALREGALYVFGALALILWFALFTYDPADPGFSQATTDATVRNGVGRVGAYVADFLFSFFGRPAYLFILMVFYLGWIRRMRRGLKAVSQDEAIDEEALREGINLGPVRFDADDAGIQVTVAESKSRYDWRAFQEFRETKRNFYLVIDRGATLIVPKRGVGDALLSEFRTLVARHVAEALMVTLNPAELDRLAHIPTENLEAYELYKRTRSRTWPPTKDNILSARNA